MLVEHRVIAEAAEWDAAVQRLIGRGAELVSVSRWIGDARVYAIKNRVVKIRRLRIARPQGVPLLAAEAEMLLRMGIPVETHSDGDWETLALDRLPGTPVDVALARASFPRRLRVLARVARATMRLHRRGIAHRDLRPDNILLDEADIPQLIDYDRAAALNSWRAAAADWIGLGPEGASPYPLWKLALVLIAPRSASIARRIRRFAQSSMRVASTRPRDRVDTELESAWQLAAASPSNAAGQGLAYYALTYRGRHYIGERPWYLRWDAIRREIDLQGRTVVELGCNMGLLSSFAMIYGATAATGVDWDSKVLVAARKAAAALGATPRFECIDLAEDPNWEHRLGEADIVVAMSILQWVPDKARLLSYIGRFNEAIFEGHDATEVEMHRLRTIGFDDVRVICLTERGRAVLHARRTSPRLVDRM
jgi:tRNA A-37 threonylcarbamoyl transferase component Bud32/SAM-dependent methyltransferase